MPLAPPKKRTAQDNDEDNSNDEELLETDSDLASGPEEPDTDEEIAASKFVRSSKTKKRKLRATSPTQFGATLASYLKEGDGASGSGELPLPANAQAEREWRKEKTQLKSLRAKELSRKETEERGRVRDVIGGWGGESERGLRKVAQRGVIKLFNAIQQTQHKVEEKTVRAVATRGSGKPTLPAPKSKVSGKVNAVGQGKATMESAQFLELIRGGGLVSSA